MKGKKGAEMTFGTLVVMILAVLVLAVLVFGFWTGWSNLWEKIKGTAGAENVESHRQACSYACAIQQVYDYCCVNRTIIYQISPKETGKKYGTCNSELMITPTGGCGIVCTLQMCGQTSGATPAPAAAGAAGPGAIPQPPAPK